MSQAMLTVCIVGGFCVGFPLIWSFVVFLISRISGWHALGQLYACPVAPPGDSFSMQSAMFGFARYKSTVTVTVADAGVHMQLFFLFKIGHPPLLIPWGDIESVKMNSFFGMSYATVQLSKQTGRSFDIYGRSADAILNAWLKRQPATATT